MRLVDADILPISFDGHTVSVWKNDLDNASTINLDKMIEQLKLYAGCRVCTHCNYKKYPHTGYCDLGGCNGGGQGIIEEDRWEYNYDS